MNIAKLTKQDNLNKENIEKIQNKPPNLFKYCGEEIGWNKPDLNHQVSRFNY